MAKITYPRNTMRALKAFSIKEQITLAPALFLRRLFSSALYRINKSFKNSISLYDLINGILTGGLQPNVSLNNDKSLLTLDFDTGFWKGTNITFRTKGSDSFVLSQILIEQEYKPLINLISEQNSNEHIVRIVDAGANIGLTTIYLKRYFPNARVIAIEPDENNFSLMKTNFSNSGLKDVIELKAGLWHKETILEIERGFRDSLDWSIALREKKDKDENKTINSITLPILKERFDFPQIDILKIDIEGSERFLFEDEETARQTLKNVRFLALEIHDEFNIREKIEHYLKDNDFKFFITGETCFAYKIK